MAMQRTLPLPLAVAFASLFVAAAAHYIKIDHNEFRSSGYPRPPLPPPVDRLPPAQHLYASKELTPAELLVDLTNDLAFRILHYHSILNRNNFAFSPSALMSVLVALYEGAAGRSANELRNVLQLPATNVIRVGYRDIHRRLRTYFFGSDNPLRGLSLNRDNVTITRDYEAILMFYGYDLGIDMVSSTAAPPTTTPTTANTTSSTSTSITTTSTSTTTTTTAMTTPAPTANEDMAKQTTPTPETIATTTTPTTTSTTTTAATSTAEMTTTTPTTTTTTTTTEAPTTTTTPTPTQSTDTTTATVAPTMETLPITTAVTLTEPTTTASSAAEATPITATDDDNTVTTTTEATPTTTETIETNAVDEPTTTATTTTENATEATTNTNANVEGDGGGGGSEVGALVSAFVAAEDVSGEPLQRIQAARVTRLPPPSKLQAPPLPPATPPRANYLPSVVRRVAVTKERRNGRQQRNKRHLLGNGNKELDASLFVALFDHHQQQHQQQQRHGGIYAATAAGGVHDLGNEYTVELQPHAATFSSSGAGIVAVPSGSAFSAIGGLSGPSGGGGGGGGDIEVKANLNTDVISHVFYLNHQQLIHTTFKVYNAVLYFKYFEHLKMSVLELELDTPNYNLMILLPDYHVDLVAAAASLRLGPTLRMMRKQLTPKWVQAIIPDFQLHGTMFLTNDLQNMGILDIFEPNRADFHPMTNEDRIYVKHIEQSINVHIRTRPINQLKRAYGTQTQPIQISVSHPFLFFVIDRALDVAVMSGRILNPQNVRIQ